MTESSQGQVNDDAKTMQQPVAHPPTTVRQTSPPSSGTGYSMPPTGNPLAAVVAAVAKTAITPVISVASTLSAPTATTAITPSTLPSSTAPVTSSPPTSTSSTLTPMPSTEPLRQAQAESTPPSMSTITAAATATPTAFVTATSPPPTPPATSTPTSPNSTLRPASMAADQNQWDYGPGGFPETTGSNSYMYSTPGTPGIHSGFDSALNSKRNSLDYPRDESYSSLLYANEKRFSDFHSLFRSVPDDEKLIEDYGCALQKEILVQGRLYISEDHVCFHANIFGWVTTLVIAFSEITAIEKRFTAFVIPNAISIVTTTNTKGHTFASFLSRDAAHDLLMAAWRKSFPCAANATVASNSYNNGSQRQSRSGLSNDEDDDADAMSFISNRGNSDSRRNRHRRSFSNASQTVNGDDGTNREDGTYWAEDNNNNDSKGFNSGQDSVRRQGSKRAGFKKVLKDVIAPIIPDDSHSHGNNNDNSSLSPNNIPGRKTGRGRSVSELPPRPTSFDGAGPQSSIDTSRSSFDYESITPSVQRARAGTESHPNPRHRNVTVPPLNLTVPTTSTTAAPSLPIPQQQQQEQKHHAIVTVNENTAQTPTACTCSKEGRHYANIYMDDVFPGTIEMLWRLLFDCDFSKSFMTSDLLKGADVQEGPWQNANDGTSTRTTRYTRWLGLPIGPKTTKAIVTDVCEYKDFNDYVTTVTSTSTPDVPSGGSFTTKVRTCITRAGPGQTRVVVTGAVEFTKNSWIKGQIEKNAAEGLNFHYREVNPWMRRYLASHSKELASGSHRGSSAPAGQAARIAVPVPTKETPVLPSVKANNTSHKADYSPKADQAPNVQQPPLANNTTKPLTSSCSSFFSKLAKMLPREHFNTTTNNNQTDGDSSDGNISHWILLAVLAIVIVANGYIWTEITDVSQQIRQIQKDILSADHDHSYRSIRHQNNRNSYMADRDAEIDRFEQEELFAREQEDAMWEWLTEREARHRRYRYASGT
ncbi:hypothetical protein FBU30_010158 [Linnemannia zychae]|nr:hypothetical protein FBU30_010158 [Linnemannia zychae]